MMQDDLRGTKSQLLITLNALLNKNRSFTRNKLLTLYPFLRSKSNLTHPTSLPSYVQLKIQADVNLHSICVVSET